MVTDRDEMHTPTWRGFTKGWVDEAFVQQYAEHSTLQKEMNWELIEKFPLKGTEKVLDYGCGDGRIVADIATLLPEGSVIGVDVSEQMIAFAKNKYPGLSFATLEEFDFDSCSESFDRICSFFVFHLVDDPEGVLRQLRKVIRSDGDLMLVLSSGTQRRLMELVLGIFSEFGLQAPIEDDRSQMNSRPRVDEAFQVTGWEMTHFEELVTPYAFPSRDGIVQWLMGTMGPIWNVPFECSHDFFQRYLDVILKESPGLLDHGEEFRIPFGRTHVMATPA